LTFPFIQVHDLLVLLPVHAAAYARERPSLDGSRGPIGVAALRR